MTGHRSTHCILIVLAVLCLPRAVTGNQRASTEKEKDTYLRARYSISRLKAQVADVKAGRAYYVDAVGVTAGLATPVRYLGSPISSRQLERALMMDFFTGRLSRLEDALERARKKSEGHVKATEETIRAMEEGLASRRRSFPDLRALTLNDLDDSARRRIEELIPLFPPEHPEPEAPSTHEGHMEFEPEATRILGFPPEHPGFEPGATRILGWSLRRASQHNTLGNELHSQKKYAEAEAAYREAIRLNPTDPTPHANLAGTLWNVEREVEATEAARTARQLGMKKHWVFERLAEAEGTRGRDLHKQKKYAEAEQAYRDAIAWDPNTSFLHNNLGNALHSQRKHQEAEVAYREAIRLDPNNESAHANLAGSIWSLGREDEAVKAAHRAMNLGKTEHPVFDTIAGDYSARSAKHYRAKRYAEAEQAAREAIAFQPKVSKYSDHLGNALFSQKKYAEAEAAYREAIRLQGDNATAHANLAATLLRLGRKDEARKMAQRAIELGKKDHWIFKELGLKPR